MNLCLNYRALFKNLILLFGLLVVISGCDKELNEIDENQVLRKLSAQERELIESNNALSLDILKAGYLQNKGENFFFSPVSVGMALGMIYNSVGEDEKFQIQNITRLESFVEREINKSYNELLSFLQVSSKHMDISYANSLWFSNQIDINEDFRIKVMAYYDAEVSELNFEKPASIDFINKWGNLKTNGTFEKLVEINPPANTDILIINAFSLNTTWNKSNNLFMNKSEFFNPNGKSTDVNTINWDGMNVRINENDRYSFLEIPFENDQFFLSVIQPESYSGIDELLESFTLNELKSLDENAFGFKANVSLPDINFSSDNSMKSVLEEIGLNSIFLPTTDLSPSFFDEAHQISNINHKAKISLNIIQYTPDIESSFTDSNLKRISIDKPFLYFVKDRLTKTVLFAGYFTNPPH